MEQQETAREITKSKPKQKGIRGVEQLSHVDHVITKAHSSRGESQLYIFEDNKAVIKMVIKSRSPTMRHVSRTHRVALDWLFDRINFGLQFFKFISYDILTSAELKFRYFAQPQKIEHFGWSYAEAKTATWMSYISVIQTTIQQVLNC